MYICDLIPLKTVKKIGTLSYFTSLPIDLGSLVEINMNGQILDAIVIGYEDIKQAKTEVRSKDFAIKKIISIKNKEYINKDLLKEVYNLSTLLGTSINNIFNTLLPVSILEKVSFDKRGGEAAPFDEGRNNYFTNDNLKLGKLLKEENTFIITPTLKIKSKIKKERKDFDKKNKLERCVSAPNLEFLLYENIDKVVIYKETSKYYYSTFKDLNIKKAIIYICKLLNIQVVFFDNIPSLENYDKNIFKENNSDIKIEVVNMKASESDDDKIRIQKIIERENSKTFEYISFENKKLIEKYLSENKKIALYTNRIGNHTNTVCEDCGDIVCCNTCDKPYIQKNIINQDFSRQNIFMCLKCNTKTEINEIFKCRNCKSFRLKMMGISTGGLYEYVKNNFDKDKVFKIDKEHGSKEIADTIKRYSENNGILVINEYGLNILEVKNIKVDLLLIVSIDSLFSMNEYNIDEKVFYMLQNMSDVIHQKNSDSKYIIQTRVKSKILESVNNPNTFYKIELENRKKNNLPPYSYILTFESESEINMPDFLKSFINYKIKLKVKESKFKNKIISVCRYIYIIEKELWESDDELREKCFLNLYNLNYKVNGENVFS